MEIEIKDIKWKSRSRIYVAEVLHITSSGTKSATFCKQFKLNFFGSIWVIETQKFLSREFFFKNAESTGGILVFGAIFDVAKVNGI